MRTIIDLPEEQLTALEAICRRDRISRAEAIRRAVADHLRQRSPAAGEIAFGIWRPRRVSGLAYEQRLRKEWDRPVRRQSGKRP